MKLDPNELPPHIKRLNPHLLSGGVEAALTKPAFEEALGGRKKAQRQGKGRLAVSLVRYGSRELDSDNLAGSFKQVRDLIAEWIGIDDGDKRISWHYGQVVTTGHPGVMVKIDCV